MTTPPEIHAAAGICAICQSPFSDGDSKTSCPGCQAEYHADCWAENRGCAVYGCSQVPATEGRTSIEVPIAYWGQENKPCPVCNAEILAAAVRCRHCGTVFQTARPVDSGEFARTVALEIQAPRLRRTIVWLFVFCLIPFSAPVAAIVGWFWLHSHRDGVETLPSLYHALIKIGIGVGVAQTVAMVLLAVVFSLVRS